MSFLVFVAYAFCGITRLHYHTNLMPQRTNDAASSSKRAEDGLDVSRIDAVRPLPGVEPHLIEWLEPRQPTRNDASSAITAMAMMAVPTQPSATSQVLALNRPINRELETITIIIAMIGTATMPLSTALHTSI